MSLARPSANGRRSPAAAESSGRDENGSGPRSGRPRRRRRGTGRGPAQSQLTSQPTSRNAYIETRMWLLEQHGSVCAYCGGRFHAPTMTLDHVAPRRGQRAYDRRDNLVLACRACNEAKRDKSPLAFLLASRGRAANLLRYGEHLSPMLIEMARALAPDAARNGNEETIDWGAFGQLEDGESPYRE